MKSMKRMYKFYVKGWELTQYIPYKGSFEESLDYEGMSYVLEEVYGIEEVRK